MFLPHDADDLPGEPENGAIVYGVFMQGARFDRAALNMAESRPGELFDVMPAIALEPVVKGRGRQRGMYNCPLYKTSRRAGTLSTTGHSTNFIVAMDVPSTLSQDHWIRRAVAMLAMLDY